MLAAGATGSTGAQEALEVLCGAYWYPLYAFVRRTGCSPHDAEDLTQGFLAEMVHRQALGTVAPEKGRFRSFLIASMKNYLSHQRERASAAKRGGGFQHVSLDGAMAEERYAMEPIEQLTPAQLYDRRWALTVLDRALLQLRTESEQTRRVALFEALSPLLGSHRVSVPFEEIGERLGMTAGAVKVALHRMRQRFREALRAEVAQTVDDPAEVDPELRHLLSALGG